MRSLQQEVKNQENKGKESANSFSQTRAVGVVKLAAGHMIIVMRSAAAGIVDAQTICPQLVQGLKKKKRENRLLKSRAFRRSRGRIHLQQVRG